jgi:peptidoglycan/xylan/chitin deacetylase (PgdA/CDA1 family)
MTAADQQPGSPSNGATLRRDLVRRAWDAYRRVEQAVDPHTRVPRGGFGASATLVRDVETTGPVIAITFDDGPDPDQTPRLLEILAARGVKASFYLIGDNAARHPELAARTHEEGHELGNHTWSHRFLTTQTTGSIRRELEKTDEVITGVMGSRPATMRPPYGAVTPSIAGWAGETFQYRTILWSLDAADWEGPDASTIADRIVAGAAPGAIVLLHDPVPETVAAVPEILDRLLERGFRFETVSALLSQNGAPG